MMLLCLLLLLLSSSSSESFVYSCEEVLLQLMNSTSFEQYATYAHVITQHDFTNWTQLEHLYLVNGDSQYSFAEIADEGRQTGLDPWTVVGYDAPEKYLECQEEFTLILKSDELPVVQFNSFDDDDITRYSSGSSVFVNPLNGMWLTKNVMSGEGNVTVYTGAGIGEEEERFMLQSWPCNSIPDWIYSFDNVITIEFDSRCKYRLSCATHVQSKPISVYRFDRVIILSSGRSDNAQNRQDFKISAKINIEDTKDKCFVDVDTQLNFDTGNTGSLDIYPYSSSPVPYQLGGIRNNFKQKRYQLTKTMFMSTYKFFIAFRPLELQFPISGCPDRFTRLIFNVLEVWCYIIIWPLPPKAGFNFSESVEQCNSKGAMLPILTSQNNNDKVNDFVGLHLARSNYWLGIECDTESNSWIWQDGQPVVFNVFTEGTGDSCTGSGTFGFEYEDKSWRQFPPEQLFDFILCAKRPEPSTTTASYTSTSEQWTPTENIYSTEPETNTYLSTQTTALTPTTFTSTIEITTTPIPTTIFIPNNNPVFPIWATILIVVCFCALFIGGFVLVRRQNKSLRSKVVEEKLGKGKKSNDQKSKKRYYGPPGSSNEWEIERTFVGIEYMSKLGEGAFGSVFMGRVLPKNIPPVTGRSIVELSMLINEHNTVAVKMLHENADSQKEREFRAEIYLMQRIGFHKRLVNMLACVTISDPILLICEYCANGNLLEFLRNKRKFMLENPEEIDFGKIITVEKQLMFSIQVANGLEYISSRGFVHRDVAARNILLDSQEGCKIGDFGLARGLGDDSENYQAQGGKLPLKWMPPEAIANYSFSIASDVWSFGVLLYEIVTLGATPYAGWHVTELLNRLKQGERIERPENCSADLYKLLRECWSEQPSVRPSFTELKKHLGDLLEEVNEDDYYLQLNANANYYVLESIASE